MPMHPEPKKLWTDALLSGEYEQGRNSLRQKLLLNADTGECSYTYCCLAVACEVAKKAGVPVEVDRNGVYYNTNDANNDRSDCFLPIVVQQWLGISNKMGGFFDDAGYRFSLSMLNDDERKSFTEIAAIIEEKF